MNFQEDQEPILEKTKLIDLINQPAKDFTTVGNASLPPYFAGKDTKLFSILQTNCSKIVDENGKPLVVEHGTNNDFTVFDFNKLGENSKDEGLFGAGFYFGTHVPAWLNGRYRMYAQVFKSPSGGCTGDPAATLTDIGRRPRLQTYHPGWFPNLHEMPGMIKDSALVATRSGPSPSM